MALPSASLTFRRTFVEKSGALANGSNTVLAAPGALKAYQLYGLNIFYANATAAAFTVRFGVSATDHFAALAGIGTSYDAAIPPEGVLVSPDGTSNHALVIVTTVTATYHLIYQLLDRAS